MTLSSEPGSTADRLSPTPERAVLAVRAIIVGGSTLACRLLGLVREIVLAALFSRAETDAFFVAFAIPNSLRPLFADGAVASALVPVLAETQQRKGAAGARAFVQRVSGAALLVLSAVSVLGVLGAASLTELFASGAHGQPGQFERTAQLTAVVFPYLLPMGLVGVATAVLNTHRRFALPALVPAFLNLALIACALMLMRPLAQAGYDRTLALAIGALIGGLMQVLAQGPALRRLGYLRFPAFSVRSEELREVARRLWPMTIGVAIAYLNVALARHFLSEMGVGAQSYYTWAMRLCEFPQGVFLGALASASLPSFSLLASQGQKAELSETLSYALGITLFWGIAATAALVVLAPAIVVTLFQRGEFSAEAAQQTAYALGAQALGVWAEAASRQLLVVHYALGSTRIPVLISALNLLVFALVVVATRGALGHCAVGLAVSIASALQMALLWRTLRARLALRIGAELWRSALRTVLISLLAAAASWSSVKALSVAPAKSWHQGLLALAVGGLVFALAFSVSATALRSSEFAALRTALGSKWRRLWAREPKKCV